MPMALHQFEYISSNKGTFYPEKLALKTQKKRHWSAHYKSSPSIKKKQTPPALSKKQHKNLYSCGVVIATLQL
jgi:hypothetical protein